MANTVADHLIERLLEWNVDTIYGYPGDGINGIMGAMDRHTERFRFVQTRHEELAAFMACAHAKFSGEVGAVCVKVVAASIERRRWPTRRPTSAARSQSRRPCATTERSDPHRWGT